MTDFKPTPEQEAILDAGRGNESLMLTAMAGCAKTTTLVMLAKVVPYRPSLALAFNKKIAVELERKFPAHFTVKTLNGLGHAAWQKVVGKRLILEDRKIGNLLKDFLQRERIQDTDQDDFINVIQLVKRARTSGLVPDNFVKGTSVEPILHDTEPCWEMIADSLYIELNEMSLWAARSVLGACIHQSYQGIIDYDDQIYMSALFGGLFPRYPEVMVDEAQDLSPLNHIQLKRCAVDRLIVCGDPRQAIYAFRGADSSSMDTLRDLRKRWIDLPLSTTFRCPKAIVARQQEHAPGFTAAAAAPDGRVERWEEWNAELLVSLTGSIAILCRNNAPLMACALRLIRSGVGCTILGREIGKSLIALTKKLIPDDREPSAECARRISAWAEHEIQLAQVNDKPERVAIITDKAECLRAVLANADIKDAGGLRRILNRLFAEGDMRVTLATGHKAKGLEWDNVLHLDSWRIPSKYAKQQDEFGNPIPLQQDMNLKYVIETRSKNALIFATLDGMEALGE